MTREGVRNTGVPKDLQLAHCYLVTKIEVWGGDGGSQEERGGAPLPSHRVTDAVLYSLKLHQVLPTRNPIAV